MKFHHIQRIWESPFYMYLKRHYCPECNKLLRVIKVEQIVNSGSDEAEKFDFESGDTFMIGNVKFIWNEFECPQCARNISIDEMKHIENKTDE